MDIGEKAKKQLRNYIFGLASMYQDNAFHNFAHASHVTASVKKLLSRIVNTDDGNRLGRSAYGADVFNMVDFAELADLAGHSYGITSDPLTQFAAVFSAIIHDVDHPNRKSIAEQNSVGLAWEMLMQDEYAA